VALRDTINEAITMPIDRMRGNILNRCEFNVRHCAYCSQTSHTKERQRNFVATTKPFCRSQQGFEVQPKFAIASLDPFFSISRRARFFLVLQVEPQSAYHGLMANDSTISRTRGILCHRGNSTRKIRFSSGKSAGWIFSLL
jgi:hypothetical protein